jgi:ribosomal protein L11 methyltransferase
MHWAEITLEIPAESAEAASALLMEAGCQGVAEKGGDPRVLTGCLPLEEGAQAAIDELEDRLANLPLFGLSAPTDFFVRGVEEEEWASAWKKHFKPLEIGRRLVIKPGWETYDGDPARVIVELDPGMAFGTGGHPTTRLCLEYLDEYVQPGMTVADIGTGSGILALAAARLGAAVVHATDIDLLPRKIARENVERNGLQQVVRVEEMDEFDAAAWNCDLAVANIIALTIIEIAPSIFARLKPGGVFISSGIVEEKLPEVLDALTACGFAVIEVREEEIWRAIVGYRE